MLQTKLHHSYHKPVPTVPVIRPEEVPEKKMEYTREVLLKFKEEEKTRADTERQAAAGMGDGGFFGGFGGGGDDGGGEKEGKGTGDDQEGEENKVEELDMHDGPTAPGAAHMDTTIVSVTYVGE